MCFHHQKKHAITGTLRSAYFMIDVNAELALSILVPNLRRDDRAIDPKSAPKIDKVTDSSATAKQTKTADTLCRSLKCMTKVSMLMGTLRAKERTKNSLVRSLPEGRFPYSRCYTTTRVARQTAQLSRIR